MYVHVIQTAQDRQANNDSPIIIVAYYYYETDDIVVGNKVAWNSLSIMFFLSVDFKVVSGWVGQNKFSCQCAVVSRLELGWTLLQKPNLPCPALLSPRQSPRRHIMYTCRGKVGMHARWPHHLKLGNQGKFLNIYTQRYRTVYRRKKK